jgi:hypothetical protein
MPGPMPAYADALSADGRWDLANFVVSLARTPPWEKGGSFGGAGFAADLSQRGNYLTSWEMCGLCHTVIDRTGIYNVDGAFLAGGMRVGYYPHGYSVSRNLTSDLETGLGRRSVPQIVTALRDGQAPDRVLNPFAMPWALFHNFTSEDATAIATLGAPQALNPHTLLGTHANSLLAALRPAHRDCGCTVCRCK